MSSDCLTCGACCSSDSDTYVEVSRGDFEAMDVPARDLVVGVGDDRYMGMADGHCVASRVLGRLFLCTIYEKRPTACRELLRGSPACLEERRLKMVRAARRLDD